MRYKEVAVGKVWIKQNPVEMVWKDALQDGRIPIG